MGTLTNELRNALGLNQKNVTFNYCGINTSPDIMLAPRRKNNVFGANLDTIKVGISKCMFSDIDEYQIEQAIEMYFSKVNKNTSKHRTKKHKSKLDEDESKKIKNNYRENFFYTGDIFLSLSRRPVYRTMKEYLISFHQSAIGTIQKTFDLLIKIFGNDLGKKIINIWEITRVDFCIDLDISWKNIIERLDRPRVKKAHIDLGEKDTLTLGGKKPVQVVVYEGKSEIIDGHTITRIEKRIFGKNKVPIVRLSEIPLLLNMSIFNEIILYRFNKTKWNKKLEPSSKLKVFNEKRLESCFVSAKKKLSHGGNFDRIGKAIKECTTQLNLDDNFKNAFKKNLIGAFDENFNLNPVYKCKYFLIDDEVEVKTEKPKLRLNRANYLEFEKYFGRSSHNIGIPMSSKYNTEVEDWGLV